VGGALHVGDTLLAGARPGGPDGDVVIGVRPSAVRLAPQGLPARIELLEDLGDTTIVDLASGDAMVKMRTDRRPAAREGDAVHLAFDAAAVHVFDAASGLRRTD
jgi:ABC-type sugar transport system ATPase subunit